jgi:hypothetical protein
VQGSILAISRAGDITVDAARPGGTLSTDGGIIRVLYAGGPIALNSGGGDISVRQALGPVTAQTRSGDINIAMDASSKTETLIAKTAKGNVTLNAGPPPTFLITFTPKAGQASDGALTLDSQGTRTPAEKWRR